MDNPAAPLSHHWQDATHTLFGVVTAGLSTYRWKLEGSAFNGREPDENRWDIDPLRLTSYSGRVTFNSTANWSFTAGYGYLRSPEALQPDESIHRVTASALSGVKLGADGQWAGAVVWGANAPSRAKRTHGLLAESEAILNRRHTVFGRAEWVQKSAEDLVLDMPPTGFAPDRLFDVAALSLGYVADFARGRGATIGLGAMGTLNVVPPALRSSYGSRTPLGGFIFLRLRPLFGTNMPAMGGMHMGGRTQ